MRATLYVLLLAASVAAAVAFLLSMGGVRYPMALGYFAIYTPFGGLLSFPCLLLAVWRVVQVSKGAHLAPGSFRGWLVVLSLVVLSAHIAGILLGLTLPFGVKVGFQISFWLRPVRWAVYGIVIWCELRSLLGRSSSVAPAT